jgi:hypothetical protein
MEVMVIPAKDHLGNVAAGNPIQQGDFNRKFLECTPRMRRRRASRREPVPTREVSQARMAAVATGGLEER